ncbi:TonB-linked outer membrane protein, SusC/RagA family [Bacteroides faecichinchillae]|uniref:TonB-linked outer membrane protein, SusC/RagA family n=1 Tax=Bacteroides faecichinchillae TaxID=871325 RepID=A0A1M4XTJ0_9BACE|nr:SusC/RagA family TonB-linked outer membrane protein [Bacteroides faecichinchillae]THG69122.1 SusC/RagA family TonB-linked outer membrane protein [Bacteroides faecichinchillae]SHE96924.1 TonB-linked outer membrane protein, SusC/RagA family [Bacteroides faecichinchillae]
MEKKHLCILICFLANALAMAGANNRTITGVVVSGEDDQPLIGASIFVPSDELQKAGASETSLGTITDLDGKFSISVPENITNIHCSYIGYEEQVIKLQTGKNDYRIVLQTSSHTLGDVVVTGYQELERRKLTAAISKVDVTDAMLGSAKSIDQALAGQIAGVAVTNTSGAPGSPARIRIRGTASLNGTQDPLWVLDGIPLEGTDIPSLGDNDNNIVDMKQSSIAGLSPNDIESITILKDAAATAIYGARAANGVIVVTTKRGKTGKPVINFNTRLTYSPNLDTSRLNLLNSQEKIDLELELMKEPADPILGIPAFYQKGGVASILKQYNLFDTYQEKGWNGLTAEAQNAINQLKTINTDWNDILFRDAFTQDYNFSISGGSEKVTYYNSLGYSKEDGNVPGVSMSRFNLTSKTSYQANNMLKIGMSLFANRRKNTNYVTDKYGYANPIYYARTANPYLKPFDSDGNYLYDYDISSSNIPNPKQGFNIFEERANTSKETLTTAINAIFSADLRFNDHWKLSSQVGLQWEQAGLEQYVGNNTFTTRNLREGSQYWDNVNRVYKYVIPEGGMHKATNSTTSQVTWKVQGEWNQTFKDIHEVQIMAGSEIRKNWYESLTSNAYGYDPKTLTTKPLIFKDEDQAKSYPLHTKSYIENAFASFYANGSYTLMKRYTLGGSIRMDGSDLFGVDKKYRFLPIYSISGLWRISNESFLESAKNWMDNLSLRLSYGLQGNIDKNTSPFLVGIYKNQTILPGNTETNIEISGAPNDKLRWEKTASYNAGIDFSILNSAINLSVDYYYRKGTDLIGQKNLPLENGFESMTINWASMENKGVEVNLQTRNITTRNFSWYTTFNFAYNYNKVLKVLTASDEKTPGLQGYPVGTIFAIKSKVDPETGRILIYPKDSSEPVNVETLFDMYDESGIGYYSYNERADFQRDLYTSAGTTEAPYTGGFINTFNYRNWELSFNFAYNLGAHVRTSPSYDIVDFDPGHNANRDVLNRWTPENKNGQFPALLNRNNYSADYYLFGNERALYRNLDLWVKRLSYVRLQNIRLAYTLPQEWLRKFSIHGATVALEGRNLFVFGSSYKNYMDPESMGNLYSTPIAKSFTFNLSLNF